MRKQPRQARSQAMVERIVSAGRVVLTTQGYDAFTTNRVAAAAGASPGSIYQYFPDKAAILELVVERYWAEVSERVSAALADRITGADLAESGDGAPMIRAVADGLLSALEADPVLLRVVAEDLPQSANRQRRGDLVRRVRDLLAMFLALRAEATHRPDPALAAWMIVTAMENIATRWVLDAPGYDRDVLLDEVVALVGGYLFGPETER